MYRVVCTLDEQPTLPTVLFAVPSLSKLSRARSKQTLTQWEVNSSLYASGPCLKWKDSIARETYRRSSFRGMNKVTTSTALACTLPAHPSLSIRQLLHTADCARCLPLIHGHRNRLCKCSSAVRIHRSISNVLEGFICG